MHVWTLPQGGTGVSLYSIMNSTLSQDKDSNIKVSTTVFVDILYYNLNVFFLCSSLQFDLKPQTSSSFLQQDSAKCVFVLHGHITAVKSLSFCSSGLALVSGEIGGLFNIWSLQVKRQSLHICKIMGNLNISH